MCQGGHSSNGAAAGGTASITTTEEPTSSPPEVASASIAASSMGQQQQMQPNLSAMGMVSNPSAMSQNTNLLQAVAMGGTSLPSFGSMAPSVAPGMDPKAMDDQVFQLLLQHQQGLSSSTLPSEAVIRLILTQKTSIQQRQLQLQEETKTLQLKMALLDNVLSKEMTNLQALGGAPAPGNAAAIPPPQGMVDGLQSLLQPADQNQNSAGTFDPSQVQAPTSFGNQNLPGNGTY